MRPGVGTCRGMLLAVFPPGSHPPRPTAQRTALLRATSVPVHQHRHRLPTGLPPLGTGMPGKPDRTQDCQQADTSGPDRTGWAHAQLPSGFASIDTGAASMETVFLRQRRLHPHDHADLCPGFRHVKPDARQTRGGGPATSGSAAMVTGPRESGLAPTPIRDPARLRILLEMSIKAGAVPGPLVHQPAMACRPGRRADAARHRPDP
jgi:hypothetical protein